MIGDDDSVTFPRLVGGAGVGTATERANHSPCFLVAADIPTFLCLPGFVLPTCEVPALIRDSVKRLALVWTDCSLVQFFASSFTAAVKSAQFTSFVFQRACCGVCWKVLTVKRMLLSMGRWSDLKHSPTLHSAGTKKASGVLSRTVPRLTRVVEPSLAHNRLFSANHSSMRSPLLSWGCSGSHSE